MSAEIFKSIFAYNHSKMKLAVVQPYLLPYIGYWQLLGEVDKLILLDDVSFIRRGWIHRNRILVRGAPHLFTIPVIAASQNKLICEIEIASDAQWRERFTKTLQQNYGRAPYYDATMQLLNPIFSGNERNLSKLIVQSLRCVANELGIRTEMVLASDNYDNRVLRGQERIIDLCRRENSTIYINPQGGAALYDRDAFSAEGIRLEFLVPEEVQYLQQNPGFVPWLSIIDILMNIGQNGCRNHLHRFKRA